MFDWIGLVPGQVDVDDRLTARVDVRQRQVGGLVQDYIRYTLGKPRVWSTNEIGVYQWWLKRGQARITPTFTTSRSGHPL